MTRETKSPLNTTARKGKLNHGGTETRRQDERTNRKSAHVAPHPAGSGPGSGRRFQVAAEHSSVSPGPCGGDPLCRMRIRILAAVLALALGEPASAQYTAQSIALKAGWNAVYLEVEPAEPAPAVLVERSGGRIESIWTYDNRFGGERAFDPSEFDETVQPPPVRVKNRWHIYHPGHPKASNLHRLAGSRAYLIRVKSGSDSWAFEIVGRPTQSDPYWVTRDFSLKGFPIDSALSAETRPTFAAFFSGSPEHLSAECKVYSTDTGGGMHGPLDKSTARIEPGKAYWIFTDGTSSYRGPVEVGGTGQDGLDFGRTVVERTLDLRNRTSAPQEVRLRLLSTLGATPAGAPVRAGDPRVQVLLTRDGQREWADLDAGGVALSLDPAAVLPVKLRARRQGLSIAVVRDEPPPSAPAGGEAAGESGSSYQGELQVTTGEGAQVKMPLQMQVADRTGLWIGDVRLRFVRMVQRDPPISGNPPTPASTFESSKTLAQALSGFPDTVGGKDDAPELTFPLILHVGRPTQQADHVLTLLRQVAVLWKEGLRDQQNAIIDPGRFVLITRKGLEAGLIDNLGLVGGTLKDGRRFSQLKTAPTFHKDSLLAGPPGDFTASGVWTAETTIPSLDPLNPFLHRYHPDHGHPKVMRQSGVPARGGLDVKRTVSFDFSETDPLAGTFQVGDETVTIPPRPEYGDTIIGGTYREVIETLTYDAVVVQGSFELRQAAMGIEKLNDGQPIN